MSNQLHGPAHVLVGVDEVQGVGGQAAAMVHQHWVQVGDVTLTAEHHGLLSVEYGVQAVGGFSEVTVKLVPASFATVAGSPVAPADPRADANVLRRDAILDILWRGLERADPVASAEEQREAVAIMAEALMALPAVRA